MSQATLKQRRSIEDAYSTAKKWAPPATLVAVFPESEMESREVDFEVDDPKTPSGKRRISGTRYVQDVVVVDAHSATSTLWSVSWVPEGTVSQPDPLAPGVYALIPTKTIADGRHVQPGRSRLTRVGDLP